MIYSIVTKTKSVIFVLPAANAHLPLECIKTLKVQAMDKYSWVNKRVLTVEAHLGQKDLKEKIWLAAAVENKSKENYPVGSEKIRDTIKTIYMNRIDDNPNVFLTTQNSRLYKDSKPLLGYITPADVKHLESLKVQIMPPKMNKARMLSDKLRKERS